MKNHYESPRILIAHAFSSDSLAEQYAPIQTVIGSSFATWWRKVTVLKTQEAFITCSQLRRTCSSNSISPKRQEWNMKRRWVNFWIMLLNCSTLRTAKTNDWVCIFKLCECLAHLPEKRHKELDKVHNTVVLGESNLLNKKKRMRND